MTQSVVSSQIKHLEQALRGTLFDRTGCLCPMMPKGYQGRQKTF
ncbi:LysR family transcriptional regulator [Pseudomonas costantinii]|nr:LysR family transcriptional regulator [Pseudomonas costantinii]NVZ18723.1 LysR family transcriptional regulator [Pseudomonas costantinii]